MIAMTLTLFKADLSSARRDEITKRDTGPRAPAVPLRRILAERAVNEPGSKQAQAFQQNKTKIAGWNSKSPSSSLQQ